MTIIVIADNITCIITSVYDCTCAMASRLYTGRGSFLMKHTTPGAQMQLSTLSDEVCNSRTWN